MLFVAATAIIASWFISLFVFGNDAAPWTLSAYAVLLVAIIALRGREAVSNFRLWERSLNYQPRPMSGFTPLELAVIEALETGSPEARLRQALARAEIT